jgi:hypothetical protein
VSVASYIVEGQPVRVYVISSRRAQNVPNMEQHLAGVPHLWVVKPGEKADYLYTGAENVVEAGGEPYTWQRNFAIRSTPIGAYCVQIDDDLRKLSWVFPGQNPIRISVGHAIAQLVHACEGLDAYYAGVAPTTNAYFTHDTYHLTGFIRSAFIALRPGHGTQFDNQFPLKADYDMTLQHLRKFGKVARVDSLLADFAYNAGSGGCVDYRTPELMAEVNRRLIEKWPGRIIENAKRPGEILMKWKPEPTSEPVQQPVGMFDD